ncbi:uncharacterized protein [Haliotis asinina]|uniref:uncharacterized protein n=1 Tax=Haliotis asinina TaxID=109174 RepID=UPI0035323843
MLSAKVWSSTLVCVALCVAAVSGECGSVSGAKISACVLTFSTANSGNLDTRKARIAGGNTTCPTDIFKDSCTSYKTMKSCVSIGGFPEDCDAKFTDELKDKSIECTYAELTALCGAPALMTTVTLFVTFFVTIFNV